MSYSPDLVWSLVKNNSSFLIKRKGVQLSSDPLNLTNKNTFKDNGFLNRKAIGIQASKDGITVSSKSTASGRASKPAALVNKYTTKASTKRAAAKFIANFKAYRPDLLQAGFRRFSALNKAARASAKKQ
ncbi:60S large subunit ribosomal protein eL28 (rpL28) [Andalucia godoyi]|uniref:60S large subunit ribosomal protein eL28 (RpL28) n=1 Tax=Andalucia godoyi TaxID=505711 RepID=A0A8K0F2V0_ANDGO|nr:60S large subunit ribosomal protein eL28 (rpL28) [Andalucia godoyi]|eukprot:ANDGO_06600.mRNA.1 60S large subunit ribosomal protein eL28 (rpL28)